MATAVATSVRAESDATRLSAYLDVVREYRARVPLTAEALGRWRLEDFRAAVEELARAPERITACAGGIGEVATVEVEAAAMLHSRLAAQAPIEPGDATARAHLRLAHTLVELADRARDRERRVPACDSGARVRARDFSMATSGLFLLRGEPELALQAAERGLRDAPDDAWLLLAAACAHEQQSLIEQQYLGAPFLAAFPWADRQGADSARRAHIDRFDREAGLAEGLLRRSLSRQPDLAQARLRLGRLLARRGQGEEAEAELRAASESTDREAQYLAELFLGGLSEERSDLAGAERHHQAALAARPQSQAARLALARIHGLTGRTRSARTLVLETLRASWPRDPGADPWWRYSVGAWREAQRLFVEMDERVLAP